VIVGLGDPGKGIPPSQSSASALTLASGGANQETQVVSLESSESAVKGSGFPAGGITGLVLASIVVSLAIAALVAKRRRRNSSCDLNYSNLSEDIKADELNADAANVEE
jgi:multisubunit Na+/H+ antiporter MnhC subunit